jgi:aryl-alcohol dehydrogenase-like predicted oxidoreductase
MITRQLGELEVSALGFGCMGMAAYYETDHTEADVIVNIQAAYAEGINFFDTADMYGNSEILLGKALHHVLCTQRDTLIIATKCGFIISPDGSRKLDLSAKHIKEACEKSLERLGIKMIDLFYLHRLPKREGLQESIDALIELFEKKKIRYIGVSEATAEDICLIHSYLKSKGLSHLFAAVQNELSLFSPEPLHNGVIQACKELGIGFVAYSPLSRGLLASANKFDQENGLSSDDFRNFLPRFQGENLKINLEIRDQLAVIAFRKKCSLPQLVLAWLLAQEDVIVPIPGTRKIKNMQDNIGSLQISLENKDFIEIANIIKSGANGSRYTPEMFQTQNIQQR